MATAGAARRRSEVVIKFARLCPELDTRRRRRAVQKEATSAPFALMGELAHHVVADSNAPWVVDLFTEAERRVENPDPIDAEIVLLGLLENLQNIASHHDTPAAPDEIEVRLGPTCRVGWRRLNAAWASVAEEVAGPTAVSLQQYETVTNATLRQTLQLSLRRMPDDRLISVADVLRYEVRHGLGTHRTK
jgi:hypothetical protein